MLNTKTNTPLERMKGNGTTGSLHSYYQPNAWLSIPVNSPLNHPISYPGNLSLHGAGNIFVLIRLGLLWITTMDKSLLGAGRRSAPVLSNPPPMPLR